MPAMDTTRARVETEVGLSFLSLAPHIDSSFVLYPTLKRRPSSNFDSISSLSQRERKSAQPTPQPELFGELGIREHYSLRQIQNSRRSSCGVLPTDFIRQLGNLSPKLKITLDLISRDPSKYLRSIWFLPLPSKSRVLHNNVQQ